MSNEPESDEEERLRKLLGEARLRDDEAEEDPEIPDPSLPIERAKREIDSAHDDLHERLSALEAQAKKGKAHYRAAVPKPDEPRPDGKGGMTGDEGRSLGVGLTVAYAIIGTPLVLYGIGFLIDRSVGGGTKLWESGLAILGCVMGVGYAMYVANGAAKR